MKKAITIIVLLLFSCGKEKKKIDLKKEVSSINNHLTVTVKAIVKEDDSFDLFYSENFLGQYQPVDIVKAKVIGGEKPQDIIFKLPEKIYPIKLRLDVGSKKYNTSIDIEKIVFSTGNNKKVISASEFKSIFKPNKYLKKIDGTNSYNRQTINNIYDPFFITINIEDMVMDLFK